MNKATMTVLFALAATAAACSDNTAAPRTEALSNETSVYGGGATESITSYDTIRFSITINPAQKTYYYLGAGNSLTFPAHSLCDVNKSTYGDGQWDKPCTAATASVTVQVKAWMDKGHTRVDFDKHVRFVPSSNPANWVVLTFADLQASLDPYFNILYCKDDKDNSCKDEAKDDLTLLTVRDPLTGKVTRRIKHFSGYNVAAGREGSSSYNRSTDSGLSVSTGELQLNDTQSVGRTHPQFSPSDVTTMLERIREARRFAGYILASG